MGLIIKNFETETGIVTDKYIKIDSLHNMGELGNIVLNCSEYYNVVARQNNKEPMRANVVYFIPDNNIIGNGNTIIDAVYPNLKIYLQEKGFTVEDDLNNYNEDFSANGVIE